MKRMMGLAMVFAATAFVGAGCDKKAEPAAPAVPVQAGAQTAEAPAAAPAPAAEAKAATPTNTAPAAGVAGAPGHEGCAGHDHAKGAAGEENCPFHEDKAAAAAKPADPAMGCGDHAVVEPVKTANGSLHFGTTFAITEPKPLAQAITGATDGQELSVRVSGKVEKVCKKKGCWMVVKDGEVEARVIMKDAAFTVPLDSEGRAAQIEGTLKVRIYSEAQAKHLAEDGGEDPTKVTGEKKELLLTATAVEIGG